MYCQFEYVQMKDEINVDYEMSENVDTETYGDKKDDHIIRYRVKKIIDMFFKDENVAIQAQILRSLLTLKIKRSYNSIGYLKFNKRLKK